MADELVILKQKTIPVSMTIADGTGVEKGTILKLADPATCSASNTAADIVAGVLAVEKVGNDGFTQASVIQGPGDWFKATASGSITVGDALQTSGGGTPNRLMTVPQIALSGAKIWGYALETATDGQTFKAVLNIQTGHVGYAA